VRSRFAGAPVDAQIEKPPGVPAGAASNLAAQLHIVESYQPWAFSACRISTRGAAIPAMARLLPNRRGGAGSSST
jgi:hypothetical protein